MKRNRAELAPNATVLPEVPAKTQRLAKDSAVHTAGPRARKAAAAAMEKPQETGGEEEKLESAATESPAVVVVKEEEGAVGWDGTAEFGDGTGYWCWWGVEEEKLLGWFPFVEEDFLCGGGGDGELGVVLWEEEEDHDIWQLQHIHEIPNTPNQ